MSGPPSLKGKYDKDRHSPFGRDKDDYPDRYGEQIVMEFRYLYATKNMAFSRVCTHSGASCCKTNSPTRLCRCYQAKHSKLTKEIPLLSEATTYIFPHRNG